MVNPLSWQHHAESGYRRCIVKRGSRCIVKRGSLYKASEAAPGRPIYRNTVLRVRRVLWRFALLNERTKHFPWLQSQRVCPRLSLFVLFWCGFQVILNCTQFKCSNQCLSNSLFGSQMEGLTGNYLGLEMSRFIEHMF